MGAGDSYLQRPGDGWCVVYGLHSITCAFHSGRNSNVSRLSYLQHRLHYRILQLYILAFFITCGGSAFSVDALVDRPSKLSRSGFTY